MKKGFTLAEVLITLIILGVIATLTITALIKNQTKTAKVVLNGHLNMATWTI